MRAAIGVVVVLAVVVGGAVVADGAARAQAEEGIAVTVQEGVPGVEQPPEVRIGGFPFLAQLAAGRIGAVHVTVPDATVQGLRLEDIVIDLTGVDTEAPYVAEHAVMTAVARPDAVEAVLGIGFDLAIRDGHLVASTTVLGLPLDVVLLPRAAGRDVEVDVTGFVLGGLGVDAGALPGGVIDELRGIRFTVPGLPAGMTLTDVGVVGDGLVLTAEGNDLELPAG